ncbi:ABC transporter ATP-binding protein [uncultured Selenomonas sp.]|uniref:ABC transporter ATP-binding protein n=1 Tax=uncultured Selenomonas sp. TaxID=159275 RepID=UPI0025E9B686|nr:ABC transporter ATP-binding protein [uncultured Selenomonas sp.]
MSDAPLLAVRNLTVSYGEKQAVLGVNFCLHRGEILVLAGESGSGKSTILRAVMGILDAGFCAGEILWEGTDVLQLAKDARRNLAGEEIAMVFQNAGASFCPVRMIGSQLYESVCAHRAWSYAEFRERAEALMVQMQLPREVLDEYPFRLSGGMAQRAGIAAAMLLQPKLILADEPTSALDALTQVRVAKELMALRRRTGVAMLLVTHHMGLAYYMADRILVLRHGEMVEQGAREDIFRHPKEAYTKELIAAVPRL